MKNSENTIGVQEKNKNKKRRKIGNPVA